MDDALVEILNLCVVTDDTASRTYRELAAADGPEELRNLWQRMADEEQGHVRHWESLLAIAREGALPQLFSDPPTVIEELTAALREVRALAERSAGMSDLAGAFLIALRLEFYLLHPAFETLFLFLRDTADGDPDADYEAHIDGLVDALNRYGQPTPELQFLGVTIKRLWDQNRQLQRQNHRDALTGLLNRRGLHDLMQPLAMLADRNGQAVGILMLDVDGFKEVNDTHGHRVGDEVLKTVAGVLASVVRKSDMAARWGGDEFLVFLSGVRPEYLHAVAERVRQSVEAARCAGVAATVSVGASHATLGDDQQAALERLIHEADERLYQAKRGGRNTAVVSG